ncbi:MAG TPA: acetoin utilization protein AcuC [Nitrospiraceae bacterium]|nr:acetoin utilization protein AcuC [Nitrospiraceae bacterium]
MKAALVYSEDFQKYNYGPQHPLKMERLKLTYELLKAYGVLGSPDVAVFEPESAPYEEIVTFHTNEYIDVLKLIDKGIYPDNAGQYGLSWGDNPIFSGIYAGSLLTVGSTLKAVDIVLKNIAPAAFSIAGGLHHAMPGRASGFCYLNDPVIGINRILRDGKTVAYIDIDAHHGDGVQFAFYNTSKVLTISLHETGSFLFPGTGDVTEIGKGEGRGFSVNLPFYPETRDEVYLWGFKEIVPPILDAFKPDILVTQLGADSLYNDPLTHLELTNLAFKEMISFFKNLKIPWVALGGGGYNILNVAKAWGLTFSMMAGVELDKELHGAFKKILDREGINAELPGIIDMPLEQKDQKKQRQFAQKGVEYIKKEVFPIFGLSSDSSDPDLWERR